MLQALNLKLTTKFLSVVTHSNMLSAQQMLLTKENFC